MKKNLTIFLVVFSSFLAGGQTTFVDNRDGNEYDTFSYNNITWMTSNLKYLSADSYCKVLKPKDEICEEYNFYPKHDLTNVCPDGWRMPLGEDWDAYWAWYYKKRIKEKANIQIDTMEVRDDGSAWFEDKKRTIELFSETNPLQLKKSDWIEGKRRIDRGTITIWLSDGSSNFHAHIGPAGVVKHTHKHNIEDKKRKIRQFVVRCVQDKID